MINPDDYDLADFGIFQEGSFGNGDDILDWGLSDEFSHKLPRYLKTEPILELSGDDNKSVYIRGLYSEKLTRKRRAAYDRNTNAVLEKPNTVSRRIGNIVTEYCPNCEQDNRVEIDYVGQHDKQSLDIFVVCLLCGAKWSILYQRNWR